MDWCITTTLEEEKWTLKLYIKLIADNLIQGIAIQYQLNYFIFKKKIKNLFKSTNVHYIKHSLGSVESCYSEVNDIKSCMVAWLNDVS